ncbi:MAG: DNA-protecting protein DprA [Chloroflexi bacterium]|nr:DNA-protecting protein DprA [Chloroflexota bacterium]
MKESERRYWLGFSRVPSIGRARFQLLLQRFGALSDAWQASSQALQEAGLDSRAAAALASVRAKLDLDVEMEQLSRLGVRAFTWEDAEYPPRLKEIYDLPPVLFVKGTLLPEDERSVAVVGTRRATAYGREVTSQLATDLARSGVTIVSGLARGIDAIAHRAALDAGGRTIAVLGNGLDITYPPEHASLSAEIAEKGALVSEHPLGVRPEAKNFPRRNRIMSGITLGTLVTEAPEDSGAIWTVRHALEQDREVFCVPGSIFSANSRATNLLIQQGAKLVMDYKDVLEELNLTGIGGEQLPLPALFTPADDAEVTLLHYLSYDPVHIDEVGRRSGLPMAQVSGTLAMMELKGLVKQLGGLNYVRTREVAAPYGGDG